MKKRWISAALAFCVALVLLSVKAMADETHVHVWSAEWSSTESSHWHTCAEENCLETWDYNNHAYDWVTVTEPTYSVCGLERRICLVCSYTEEQEIPQLILPDYFTVTIMELSTGETTEQQMSTAGGASYTVPRDGVYVDSDAHQVTGTFPLASDLTLYKLSAVSSVSGTCTAKAHTVYSGILPDVPRTLTEEDCTFVSFHTYHETPGNCNQEYRYTMPKCKLKVNTLTLDGLEKFSRKNKVLMPSNEYYDKPGVYFYISDMIYNELTDGLLYSYPLDRQYVANGEERYRTHGEAVILDFMDEIFIGVSHRVLLRNCEILEDKEASVTIYGGYGSHSYEAEWTIDLAPTLYSPGSKSRHCKLCDGKTDITVIPPLSHQESGWNPFADVKETNWFYDDVRYVYERGLMTGTSATSFSPYWDTGRGMIAEILWRLEGQPESGGEMMFRDVEPYRYYYEAVHWAAAHKIVKGYNAVTFSPNKAITRQELVTILWRYAGSPESTADLSAFTDSGQISDYASHAMKWAVEQKILQGKGGNKLDPKGRATRAEVAVVLMRFLTGSK